MAAKTTPTKPAEDPRIAKLMAQIADIAGKRDQAVLEAESNKRLATAAHERYRALEAATLGIASRIADAAIEVAQAEPHRVTSIRVSNYPDGKLSSVDVALTGEAS